MGFLGDLFNDAVKDAIFKDNYKCPKCGGHMSFEDDMEMTLICDVCHHDMDVDDYGHDVEEYDWLYEGKTGALDLDDD